MEVRVCWGRLSTVTNQLMEAINKAGESGRNLHRLLFPHEVLHDEHLSNFENDQLVDCGGQI